MRLSRRRRGGLLKVDVKHRIQTLTICIDILNKTVRREDSKTVSYAQACAPRATADPSLVLLRRAARPLGKDSFACNSSDFSAHGGLFEPELDRMLQGAAPQLVAAWAASRLEGLNT